MVYVAHARLRYSALIFSYFQFVCSFCNRLYDKYVCRGGGGKLETSRVRTCVLARKRVTLEGREVRHLQRVKQLITYVRASTARTTIRELLQRTCVRIPTRDSQKKNANKYGMSKCMCSSADNISLI